jgi:hypothetical protein
MSDWSSQEYLDMLGLIPDGKLPQKVIAEELYEDEEETQTEKPKWNLESVEEDRPLDDDFSTRRLLSTQEEIAEDLDNELILGFGKKNKEQKTGKARDVVKKLTYNQTNLEDNKLLPEFEIHMEKIEIQKPDLKEKVGGLVTETSWADLKQHKVLTVPRS